MRGPTLAGFFRFVFSNPRAPPSILIHLAANLLYMRTTHHLFFDLFYIHSIPYTEPTRGVFIVRRGLRPLFRGPDLKVHRTYIFFFTFLIYSARLDTVLL